MTKYWHAFYVSDYKGGELHSTVNASIEKVLDFLVSDCILYDEFQSVEDIETLTDEDLYDIYMGNISNNTYAFDTWSAPEVYSTSENGKLVEDFPTKEDIIYYMRNLLKEYIENK